MKLTQDQQDLLDGKFGEGAKLAMKVQVAIGESFGAERMVPITRAHVALSNQDADRWLAEKLAGLGAKCRVRPTVNPGFCLSYFKKMGVVTNKDYEEMERTDRAYRALGAELSYNCTPYMDTNVPLFGEICAFSESSATPYVNSIWGARSNREGANSALFASITGYVPEYVHLSTKIGHKTKKIRHKKRIDVQDSSTFLTSFKLVRQTMPSIMQTRSADGRVTFPILLRRQVA